MTVKASWLWNGSTRGGRTVFGFSESWYSDLAPADLIPAMKEVAKARVAGLGSNIALFGYRISDTAPNSRAYVVQEPTDIQSATDADALNVPNDAALCMIKGSAPGTVKRYWMHAVDDQYIAAGDFVGATFQRIAARFVNALAGYAFKFRYKDTSQVPQNVGSIDATGNVVMLANVAGVAKNTLVQLLRVKNTSGRAVTGIYKVSAFTDASHFQLANWNGSVVAASGQIRFLQYLYTVVPSVPITHSAFTNVTVRPGTRKVGRPFGQLVGRRPARH